MKWIGKLEDLAYAAGCEAEVGKIDALAETIQGSAAKNIAVLGERKCGKTTLINQIAGKEARKPSKLPIDEKPLMIAFGDCEAKTGYEMVKIEESVYQKENLAFYEIPMDLAVDAKKGVPGFMLEEMDAVIYIVSAIMPLTASDLASLAAIAGRFPLVIYISKADLAAEEEYKDIVSYVREHCAEDFAGSVYEIYDSLQPDAAEKMIHAMAEMSIGEVRSFHMMRLEQIASGIIAESFGQMLGQLEEEKKRRISEAAAKNQEYRSELLKWDSFRVKIVEKEQDCATAASRMIYEASEKAKQALNGALKKTNAKNEWLSTGMKEILRAEMDGSLHHVMQVVKDRADADAAWLVCEVNREFGTEIEVADMKPEQMVSLKEAEKEVKEPGVKKIAAAAGAGLLAGGAIISSLAILPTYMIALPASLATLHFARESAEDYENYNRELKRVTERTCDKNFEKMNEKLLKGIHTYYENLTESIREYCSMKQEEADVKDLEAEKKRICGLLEKLSQEEGCKGGKGGEGTYD